MTRTRVLVQMGAEALAAAMLAAALERSGAGTATTLIAASALVVAGAGAWLAPAVPASRVALLAPAAVLLVIATAVDRPLTAASQASARATGAPFVICPASAPDAPALIVTASPVSVWNRAMVCSSTSCALAATEITTSGDFVGVG